MPAAPAAATLAFFAAGAAGSDGGFLEGCDAATGLAEGAGFFSLNLGSRGGAGEAAAAAAITVEAEGL